MKSLNASDAKREFGDLLLSAQSEPICINKNGKAVAVVLSTKEYEQLQSLKQEVLKAAIETGLEDVKNKKITKGKDVLNRLRGKLS